MREWPECPFRLERRWDLFVLVPPLPAIYWWQLPGYIFARDGSSAASLSFENLN